MCGPTHFAVVLTAVAILAGFGQRAQAQQTGGVVFELPEIRYCVAVAAGVVPDYMGSDDYTFGAAPGRYFQPVRRPLTLSIGATVTYGSSDYMQIYFGVDSNNAARTGVSQFSAGSDLRDVRIAMMAIYSLRPNRHLSGGLLYSRLLGDASDSPVVDDRGSSDQFFAGVGIASAW